MVNRIETPDIVFLIILKRGYIYEYRFCKLNKGKPQ